MTPVNIFYYQCTRKASKKMARTKNLLVRAIVGLILRRSSYVPDVQTTGARPSTSDTEVRHDGLDACCIAARILVLLLLAIIAHAPLLNHVARRTHCPSLRETSIAHRNDMCETNSVFIISTHVDTRRTRAKWNSNRHRGGFERRKAIGSDDGCSHSGTVTASNCFVRMSRRRVPYPFHRLPYVLLVRVASDESPSGSQCRYRRRAAS